MMVSLPSASTTATLALKTSYGKGNICATGFDIGSQYLSEEQFLHRTLIKKVIEPLYDPTVKIGSVCGKLEVVVLEKNGKLLVQLINTAGNHSNLNLSTDDTIPPAVDIDLSIKLKHKPQRLILQPQGAELRFKYVNGRANTHIERINNHSII